MTIIQMKTTPFHPTLDMDLMPLRQARELAELLGALNTITNAAIAQFDEADLHTAVSFLDDLQAIFHQMRSEIVDAIHDRPVRSPGDVAERSWAIAAIQVSTAMGPLAVIGENASGIDDDLTKAFLASAEAQ